MHSRSTATAGARCTSPPSAASHDSTCVRAVFESNNYRGSIYLIFEYLDHDLWGLNDRIQKAAGAASATQRAAMPAPMAKSLAHQMLAGLAHCHARNVLHRDLKASNLLISRDGVLKLADFGLARPYVTPAGKVGELTYRVCTLWYRCARPSAQRTLSLESVRCFVVSL